MIVLKIPSENNRSLHIYQVFEYTNDTYYFAKYDLTLELVTGDFFQENQDFKFVGIDQKV